MLLLFCGFEARWGLDGSRWPGSCIWWLVLAQLGPLLPQLSCCFVHVDMTLPPCFQGPAVTTGTSGCNAGDARDEGSIPGWGRSPWRRAWQPTPIFLSGDSHGQRSLAGYSPWGRKESDTTEATERARTLPPSIRRLTGFLSSRFLEENMGQAKFKSSLSRFDQP